MTAAVEGREIVVVTGASSGIGEATARELARRGYHVLAGVRRQEDADQMRAVHIQPVILDITKEIDVARLLKQITEDQSDAYCAP
jgi:NADP-dependent 3-hydroxy acid dehydrogenase YdfG